MITCINQLTICVGCFQAANKPAASLQPADGPQPALYPRFQSLEALWSAVPSPSQEVHAVGKKQDDAPEVAVISVPGPSSARTAATEEATRKEIPTTAADGRPLTKLEIKRLKRAARPGRQAAAAAAAAGTPIAAANLGSERIPDVVKPTKAMPVAETTTTVVADPTDPRAVKKKSSGGANADEAQKIREALGYVGSSTAQGAASQEPVAKKQKTEPKKGKKNKTCDVDMNEVVESKDMPSATAPVPEPSASKPAAAAPLAASGAIKGAKFGFGFNLAEAQAAVETESKVSHIMMLDSATPDGLVPRRVGPH